MTFARSPVYVAALVEQVWPRRVLELEVSDLLVSFVVSTQRYHAVRACDVDELAEKLAVPRNCIEMSNVPTGIEFRVDLGDMTPVEVPCGRVELPTGRTATLELCRDTVEYEGQHLVCLLEVGHGGEHQNDVGVRWTYEAQPPGG